MPKLSTGILFYYPREITGKIIEEPLGDSKTKASSFLSKLLYIHQQHNHSRCLPTSVIKVVGWFLLLRPRLFLLSSLNKHGVSVTALESLWWWAPSFVSGGDGPGWSHLLPASRLALDGCCVLWQRRDQMHCFAAKLVIPDAGLYTAEGRDLWDGMPPLVYIGHRGFSYHRSVWGPAAGEKSLHRPAAIIWSHGATKGWAAADQVPTSGPQSWLLNLCDCSNYSWQETAAADWEPLLTQADCTLSWWRLHLVA